MNEKINGFHHVCLDCQIGEIPWQKIILVEEIVSEKKGSRGHPGLLDGCVNVDAYLKGGEYIFDREVELTVHRVYLLTWPAMNEELQRLGVGEDRLAAALSALVAEDKFRWGMFVLHKGQLCINAYLRSCQGTRSLWKALGIPE